MVTRTPAQPMLTRPRVSVVIPCYRYGHFLGQCVSSVVGQEGADLDVTIIDDASPDDSAAVARRLAEADERIRVVVHASNQGHIATYNEGLAAAEGDYVLLLSADDMLAPGALARAAALMEAHPDVGLVYGFARTFAEAPPPARTAVRSWSIWPGAEWLELVARRVSNPIYTPEAVMRTKTMHELVGYDHRLPHAADFLMWLRAASRVSIGRVNGVDQAYYRFHGHNMHMELFPGALRDLRERYLAFEILFEELGDAGPAHLREVAAAGVAREALVLAVQGYRHGPPPTDQATTLGQLVAFAAEIHPPSRHGRLGRAYDAAVARARAGKGPRIPAAVTAQWDRVLRHVRWLRWRATGIDGPVGSV